MTNKIRFPAAAALCAMLVVTAACSGPSEAEGTQSAGRSERKAVSAVEDNKAQGRTDRPPADYVRYRCSECSCSVFTGDGADCNRPSCKHHWSTHVRTFK